jgi:hypothetical protein
MKLWTKCMAIMDIDSVEYGDLDATEATELFERAQERIDVYSKNKKILPPKKQTRQPDATKQAGAAARRADSSAEWKRRRKNSLQGSDARLDQERLQVQQGQQVSLGSDVPLQASRNGDSTGGSGC